MQRAARYPNDAVEALHQHYGNAFVFGFGPTRFHWLIGPTANRFILGEAPDAFSQRRAYAFLEPIGGPNALISSDEPHHSSRRRSVQPAFHRQHLASWLAVVERRLGGFFEERVSQPPFAFYREVRTVVLAAVAELLLGGEAVEGQPAFASDLAAMMDYINEPMLVQRLRVPVPGLPWLPFVRTRTRVNRWMYAEIERRRREQRDGSDVLSLLLAGGDLNNRELRDQTLSLLSAGFDTTSAGLSWAVQLLADHPDELAQLTAELHTTKLAELLQQPRLDRVVKETLRLYPPASAGLRQTTRAVSILGYHVPAGSLVAFSIYLTHRNPALFDDPLTFRPDRWVSAKPFPFAYLPFGYGARYCIGASLATSVIKVALWILARSYRIEPHWQRPVAEAGTTLHPKDGLPLRLEPR